VKTPKNYILRSRGIREWAPDRPAFIRAGAGSHPARPIPRLPEPIRIGVRLSGRPDPAPRTPAQYRNRLIRNVIRRRSGHPEPDPAPLSGRDLHGLLDIRIGLDDERDVRMGFLGGFPPDLR